MYYKETIINGITYYQSIPNGEYKEVSNKKLTERITQLKQVIADLERTIRQGD